MSRCGGSPSGGPQAKEYRAITCEWLLTPGHQHVAGGLSIWNREHHA